MNKYKSSFWENCHIAVTSEDSSGELDRFNALVNEYYYAWGNGNYFLGEWAHKSDQQKTRIFARALLLDPETHQKTMVLIQSEYPEFWEYDVGVNFADQKHDFSLWDIAFGAGLFRHHQENALLDFLDNGRGRRQTTKHQLHILAASFVDRYDKKGDFRDQVFWRQMRYEGCFVEAQKIMGWRQWWDEEVKKTNQNKSYHLVLRAVTEFILNDIEPRHKEKILTRLIENLSPQARERVFFSISHQKIFARGLFRSWMNCLSATGISPKRVADELKGDIETYINERAYDFDTYKPLLQLPLSWEDLDKKFIHSLIVGGDTYRNHIPRQKILEVGETAWKKMQKQNVVSRSVPWQDLSEIICTHPLSDRSADDERVRGAVNYILRQKMKDCIEKPTQNKTPLKRKM